MKFFISLGIFDLKYLLYCILFLIIQIYFYLFIDSDDKDKNKIINHKLLNQSCIFLGFLLNIIPEWIINKISDSKISNNLSIKDISKIFFINFFLLIAEFLTIIPKIINKKKNNNKYENYFYLFNF